MSLEIIGDSGNRKSNFDPKLAEEENKKADAEIRRKEFACFHAYENNAGLDYSRYPILSNWALGVRAVRQVDAKNLGGSV